MKISQLIASIPLFQGFTEDELAEIQQVSSKQEVGPNVDIIKEGETSEDFFVLLKGKADVLKESEQDAKQFKLATLSVGDVCGEIAFIDHLPRSSTVRTVEPATFLHISSASILTAPHGKEILNKLIQNIAKTSIKRLRDFNEHYLNSLQTTFNLVKNRQSFGIFFLVILTLFSLVTVSEYVIHLLNFNVKSHTSTFVRMFIICSPCAYWIWKFKIPIKTFGISTQNWGSNILEGIGMGLILAVAAMLIDALYNQTTFQKTLLGFLDNFRGFAWLLAYTFSSYVQEFFARGLIQSSLQRFLNDERGFYAVFITSVGFAGIHIHRGWQFPILAFLASLILGIFYLRRQNLIGVTLVHMIAGFVYLPVSDKYI